MEKLFLSVVSPLKVLYEGEVDRVSLPGTAGPFAILPGHAPIVSSLDPGVVMYVTSGEEHRLEVTSGGFVEKTGARISVCVY